MSLAQIYDSGGVTGAQRAEGHNSTGLVCAVPQLTAK